jgi:transcriptional regulator with XRE-family HTH domain
MSEINSIDKKASAPRSQALRSSRKIRNAGIAIDWNKLGRDVEARRLALGLSTRELEIFTGVSHSTIVRLENGRAKWAGRAETYLTLAIAIGMDPLSYAFIKADSNLAQISGHNAKLLNLLRQQAAHKY